MGIVTDDNGREIDFDAATVLMDDEVRERLHGELAPCDEQEFFDAYCAAHKNEFGEDFRVD